MTTDATPGAPGSNDQLGLVPERAAFEAWKRKQGGYYMSRNNAPGCDMSGYQDAHTQGQWEAWLAATAAERERFPNLLPVIEWLERGCDPKEAVKELRIYQQTMTWPNVRIQPGAVL